MCETEVLLEPVLVPCPEHEGEGCSVCGGTPVLSFVEHEMSESEDDWEPDYEAIWEAREEERAERWLARMDRLY